jgi:SAM-dependent methyltransferase
LVCAGAPDFCLHTCVAVSDQGPDWRSYDSVAEPYARVRAIHLTLLARDLVALVAPAFRGRVLDVGAGTGVAAHAALSATGADGTVVAVDPSMEMLRRIDARGRIPAAIGATPDLPFGPDRFDAVVANLVIADVPDYRPALADMVRVLRPGGRVGISVWGALGDAPPVDDDLERTAYEVWSKAAAEIADPDAIETAAHEALPWGSWFADPTHLRSALAEAGSSSPAGPTATGFRTRTGSRPWEPAPRPASSVTRSATTNGTGSRRVCSRVSGARSPIRSPVSTRRSSRSGTARRSGVTSDTIDRPAPTPP